MFGASSPIGGSVTSSTKRFVTWMASFSKPAIRRGSSENRGRRRYSTSWENVGAICKQGQLITARILGGPR